MEWLSRCTVKIRYNDKYVKCRFFVVPGDDPALSEMPDVEFLGTIQAMCETIDNKTTCMKFDSQNRQRFKPLFELKRGHKGK